MNISEVRANMQKTLDFLKDEMAKIRGSRANPGMIDDIMVSVYGSSMPIKQLGTVTVVDPTLITVQVWDQNNAEEIRKAIESSDLNVNPSIDGNLIRVPLPPLSEERREELVKVVKKVIEEAKVAIRHIRRDFLDSSEEDKLSEDDKERGKKEIQKLVDEFNEAIEDEFDKKEKELLTI